jgi:ribosomal protein S18 acetylase RimI-like enzyme
MELRNNKKLMSARGFLLTHYSSYPEIKEKITHDIFDSIYLVCETKRRILGFLKGYTSRQWLHRRPNMCDQGGNQIKWSEASLNKLGIDNIHNFQSFGVIDKICVDKRFRKKKVAFNLLKLFTKILLEHENHYVLSEVVSHVYKNDKQIDIKNKASIKFHEKLGFMKVGNTFKYDYCKTFLKEEGSFKDHIYMAKINDLPYKYKRIFVPIR